MSSTASAPEQGSFKDLVKEIQDLRTEVRQDKSVLEKLATTEEENEQLKKENEQLKKENKQLKKENEQLKKENSEQKVENESLESEVRSLKSKLDTAETFNRSVRANLAALHSRAVSGTTFNLDRDLADEVALRSTGSGGNSESLASNFVDAVVRITSIISENATRAPGRREQSEEVMNAFIAGDLETMHESDFDPRVYLETPRMQLSYMLGLMVDRLDTREDEVGRGSQTAILEVCEVAQHLGMLTTPWTVEDKGRRDRNRPIKDSIEVSRLEDKKKELMKVFMRLAKIMVGLEDLMTDGQRVETRRYIQQWEQAVGGNQA